MISGKTYYLNYILVSGGELYPGKEVAGSLQKGNPDMNEWMQNHWGTKTRKQCGHKFTLPTLASIFVELLNIFSGKKVVCKNKGEEAAWAEHSILVDFWCTAC